MKKNFFLQKELDVEVNCKQPVKCLVDPFTLFKNVIVLHSCLNVTANAANIFSEVRLFDCLHHFFDGRTFHRSYTFN